MIKKILFSTAAICATSLSISAQCPTANAGSNLTVCQGDTLQLVGSDPGAGVPKWTAKGTPIPIIGGELPNLFVSFSPNGDNDTVGVSVIQAGPQTLYYSITATGCPTVKDSMILSVDASPSSYIVSPSSGASGGLGGIGGGLGGLLGGFGGFGNSSITNCEGVTTFTVVGSKPGTGETGIWSIKAPAAGSIVQTDSTGVVSGISMGTTVLNYTVSDGGSCPSVSTVTINTGTTKPTAAVAGNDVTGCVGEQIQLVGNTPTTGDPMWTSSEAPSFTPAVLITPIGGANDTVDITLNTLGNYKLYYTISIGTANPGDACTSRDSLELTVDCTSGIEENSYSDLQVLIQPNPASGQVTLSLSSTSAGVATLNILSVEGRVVMAQRLGTANDLNKTIDISTLDAGVYIIKVEKSDAVYTSKLIVQ